MSFKSVMQRFRQLDPRDFRILLGVETGMTSHEFVPRDLVLSYSNLPPEEALYRLERVEKLGVLRRTSRPYVGYSLNYLGYDFLALNFFVKAELIEALGGSLGLGKEADVYEAFNPQGALLALKFHRLGRISFRQTRRVRGYVKQKALWLFRSKAAAEREYEALEKLHAHGIQVVRPIAQNRHAVLMDKIEGRRLVHVTKLPRPKQTMMEILENIGKAWREAGIIHCDLSEYNVMISPDGSLKIIDWPQYVTATHPNADFLLKRDIQNIWTFFQRKFKIRMTLEEALKIVGKE
ncbi:RIO1 family regulatory kinase/ATPase [Candidatus Hecatella orcuttiae]|jgi:RIO kinase 2|uniref:RIO1 family regulatory kinase/ATPase domain-containing protein n=1 Tax=Candidatus Hecatella orcuttiae TaxID=1935119 RepID=UPI002867BB01|nr:RIO1 family regulatory kinase/ATPase [Candidatus Hecatella orcuttiae]